MSYYVHNEARYEAAIKARIQNNSRRGRLQRWLAEEPSRAEIVTFLELPFRSEFISKMRESFSEWGSLTAGQEAAVRKCMAAQFANVAKRRAEAATSEFVGEVGKREVFSLTLVAIYENESEFGLQYSHKFKTESGNIVVWKTGSGEHFAETKGTGQFVTVKATVKQHWTSKEGAKTTYISRLVAA